MKKVKTCVDNIFDNEKRVLLKKGTVMEISNERYDRVIKKGKNLIKEIKDKEGNALDNKN